MISSFSHSGVPQKDLLLLIYSHSGHSDNNYLPHIETLATPHWSCSDFSTVPTILIINELCFENSFYSMAWIITVEY